MPPGAARYLVDDFQRPGGEVGAFWVLDPFDGVPATRYRLQRREPQVWLRGESDGGAALLSSALDLELRQLPRLQWRWRVERPPVGADLRHKGADDCGARVFVAFAYDSGQASLTERIARSFSTRDLPGSALCYVWDDSLPEEEVLPNPYTDRTQVVVVRHRGKEPDGWRRQERNVLLDYRAAFGADPPRVTGIAVMVDSDQTGSRAVAAFDDFVFLGAPDGAASSRPR